KKVAIISIMMQSMNQQCNALQSVIGIFLHSCNAPEKVIKTLSHLGLSISLTSIHDAIHSLSAKATLDIRALGRSLLAAYAYDNFDIDFKTTLPTADQPLDTLVHLTSGLLFLLDHGVTLEDLRCSEALWKSARVNDERSTRPPDLDVQKLMMLHPDHEFRRTRLTRRMRYNAWEFRRTLVHHGPQFFRQYESLLGEPEAVERIPVTKLKHVPARAMDINQSKVSGNIRAVEELMAQGGVGDPNADPEEQSDVVDISPFVVLIHGDLGTLERVNSAQERRALEDTPWRRMQYAVLTPGFFHLKMAAADTIWRIFINHPGTQDDPNSLKTLAGILRPKETGKIATKPGFRRMHEIIGHVGAVLRLDCWRLEARRRSDNWTGLEEFANAKPAWDLIIEMSEALARNYVAGSPNLDLFEMRSNPSNLRDQQHENTLILHQYLLLYEELSFGMNVGDIGRLDTIFPMWIYLFRASGKHKYASAILKFLTDVHFVYPEGLKRAVRYNCLVNPTGKPNAFRAVDWLVELNNLFTKDTYGGSGSNYTKKRVITESILIEIYRACHKKIERDLHLSGLTSAKGKKDLTTTFKKLGDYIRDTSRANEYQRERKTSYSVSNMLDKGVSMYETEGWAASDDVIAAEGDDFEISWDDYDLDDIVI
ncbi:hypothetical protein FA95DRAFT_1504832, partial [Auriscalpium vulgare]